MQTITPAEDYLNNWLLECDSLSTSEFKQRIFRWLPSNSLMVLSVPDAIANLDAQTTTQRDLHAYNMYIVLARSGLFQTTYPLLKKGGKLQDSVLLVPRALFEKIFNSSLHHDSARMVNAAAAMATAVYCDGAKVFTREEAETVTRRVREAPVDVKDVVDSVRIDRGEDIQAKASLNHYIYNVEREVVNKFKDIDTFLSKEERLFVKQQFEKVKRPRAYEVALDILAERKSKVENANALLLLGEAGPSKKPKIVTATD